MTDMINGVDRDRITDTVNAIAEDPEIAAFNFRIENAWLDGGLNRSTVRDFYGAKQTLDHAVPFELVNDEPPVLLSGDRGPNPVENLLHALAGCMTTSLIYHATARGIDIGGVRTRFIERICKVVVAQV